MILKVLRAPIHIIDRSNLMSLLFALIISVNSIRYFMNIQESSLAIYSIYILAICCGIMLMQRRFNKSDNSIVVIVFGAVLMIAYGLITSPIIGSNGYISTVKMIITFLVAHCFFLMSTEEIRRTIRIAGAIIMVYCLFLVFDTGRIDRYLSGGSNYLVLTLPIGLYCSIFITRIIYKICNKKMGSSLFGDIVLFMLSFWALTRLPARGSMLFPFLVGIVITMLIERKHFFKLIVALVMISLLIYLGYLVYMNIAGDYAKRRMLSLFSGHDYASEERIKVYKIYIKYAVENLWIIWGGGVGSSIKTFGYYPHNIYLQLFGEFGVIGLFNGGYITVLTLIKSKWILRHEKELSENSKILFYELLSGFLYLFLCFMKSFSLYDICSLLIFVMAIFSIYHNEKYNVSAQIEKKFLYETLIYS